MKLHATSVALWASLIAGTASAAPVVYEIDPMHTYPSFEADHLGMSKWRGKFNKSSGRVTLDKEAGQGTIEVRIDLASIDFGLEQMNKVARGSDFFDTRKYPTAHFSGRLDGFVDGAPRRAVGELTLHGVTRPIVLTLETFKCMPHPIFKRDWCGADASATLNREEFGMPMGKEYGIKMEVGLRIQVEAVAAR
jgi:polyisoprenoid-binding protein YceI